jgi:zinc/manganese transport system substrate-binding protein
VPPSAAHLAEVVAKVKQTHARVIIMEPFYDKKTADKVARETGAQVLVLPPSVGGLKGLDDYISVMRYDIRAVATALK